MTPESSEDAGRSDRFVRSDPLTRPKRLRPAGGYRKTASFQTATIIYDATYWFCEKFLDPALAPLDQGRPRLAGPYSPLTSLLSGVSRSHP